MQYMNKTGLSHAPRASGGFSTPLGALALALLCLMGCASPSPPVHELRDGPMPAVRPVFTPPGYAPAGAGLPEYMPGQPNPTVPRGTDTRVLPPTREPGLWAGDAPVASSAPEKPVCWDMSPDLPDALLADRAGGSIAHLCAAGLDNFGRRSSFWGAIQKLSPEARRCLMVRLFGQCTVGASITMKHWQYQIDPEPFEDALTNLTNASKQDVNRSCKGPAFSQSDPLFKAMNAPWEKTEPWSFQ
jgi:hypothetical protein